MPPSPALPPMQGKPAESGVLTPRTFRERPRTPPARRDVFARLGCIMTNENASQTSANNASDTEKPQVTGGIQRKTACIISWIVVAAMLALIFFMSSRSGIDIDNNTGIFSAVKQWLSAQAAALFGHEVDVSPVGHFCEYLVLGAALCNALRFHLKPQGPAGALLVAKPVDELSKWAPIVAAALSSLYGVTDEFHQIFTPGRSCDPMDWLVDTIAAALGALICYLALKALRARR